MARRDRRRAEAGALAASVLAHLVIFVVLAREAAPTLRLPASAEPDIQIQLVTEPPPPAPAAAPQPRSSQPRPSEAPPRSTPAPAKPARARPAPARPELRPQLRPAPAPPRAIASRPPPPRAVPAPAASPSPTVATTPAAGSAGGRAAASGGAAAGSAHGRWTVEGEDGQDGVRKFLRATVGCSHADYVKLSTDEQANCDRRVGEEARKYLDKSLTDPDKRAAFIAAAQAQERRRADRTGPLQDIYGPCNGQSNLGVGCRKDPSKHPDPFTNPPPQ
jgi:hypothetical protein